MAIIKSESSMVDFREIHRIDWAKQKSYTRREGNQSSATQHRERFKQDKSAKKYQKDYSSDLEDLESDELGVSSELECSMNSAILEVPLSKTPLMPSDSDIAEYKDKDCNQARPLSSRLKEQRSVLGEINTSSNEFNRQNEAKCLDEAGLKGNSGIDSIIASEEKAGMALHIAHIERQQPRYFEGPLELSNYSEDPYCNDDQDGYREIISEFFPYHDFFWSDESDEITELKNSSNRLYYKAPSVSASATNASQKNSEQEKAKYHQSSISAPVIGHHDNHNQLMRFYDDDELSLLCPPPRINRQPPETEGYFSMIIENENPENEDIRNTSTDPQNIIAECHSQGFKKLFHSSTPNCSSEAETKLSETKIDQEAALFDKQQDIHSKGKVLQSFVTDATESSFLTSWAEGLTERFPTEDDPRVSIYTPSTSAYSIEKDSVFLFHDGEHSSHGSNSEKKNVSHTRHSAASSAAEAQRFGNQTKLGSAYQENVIKNTETAKFQSYKGNSSFSSRIGSKISGLRLNRGLKKGEKEKIREDREVSQVSEARNSIQLEYVDYGTATMDTLKSNSTASPLGRELDAMLDEAIADQQKFNQKREQIKKVETSGAKQNRESEGHDENHCGVPPQKSRRIFKFKEQIQKMRARPHTLVKPLARKSLESFSNIPKAPVQCSGRTTRRGLQIKGALKRALEHRENRKPLSR